MSFKVKALLAAVSAPVIAATTIGCGTGGNNNQGATFAANGYFAEANPTSQVGLSALLGFLSTDSPRLYLPVDNRETPAVAPVEGAFLPARPYMELENRLRNQFIRVTRVDCEYRVPGASIPIPGDSFQVGATVSPNPNIGGPQIAGSPGSGGVGIGGGSGLIPGGNQGGQGGAPGGGGNTGGGAVGNTGGQGGAGGAGIPGPATGRGGLARAEIPLVSPSLFAFLNNNRASLPQLPITLETFCSAVGVTTSGDVFETNQIGLPVYLFDEAQDVDPGLAPPAPGAGGDLAGVDNSD